MLSTVSYVELAVEPFQLTVGVCNTLRIKQAKPFLVKTQSTLCFYITEP